jgi:hypothetical protein
MKEIEKQRKGEREKETESDEGGRKSKKEGVKEKDIQIYYERDRETEKE